MFEQVVPQGGVLSPFHISVNTNSVSVIYSS